MVKKIIAVNFDGTIVTHMYPAIGNDVPNAIKVLHKLQEQGIQLILWTMRSGPQLQEAVDYCTSKGITFWGINENPNGRTAPRHTRPSISMTRLLAVPFSQTNQAQDAPW